MNDSMNTDQDNLTINLWTNI